MIQDVPYAVYKFDHLVINSTTTVAAEARANPALPGDGPIFFCARYGKTQISSKIDSYKGGFFIQSFKQVNIPAAVTSFY